MLNDESYRVDAPVIPHLDRSGTVGPRLLRLLGIQIQRTLQHLESNRQEKGIDDGKTIVIDIPYCGHVMSGSISAFAVFARFSSSEDRAAIDMTSEGLEEIAISILHTWVSACADGVYNHGTPEHRPIWPAFSSARFMHMLAIGAWMLWHRLDDETRLQTAKVLAKEADSFLDKHPSTTLFGNAPAEYNGWTGGGLATVACMLRHHPHSRAWLEKGAEFMVNAYATEEDVESDVLLDGKPLREQVTGANVFPDYTLEHHGFIHPDYMASVSEMVRSAIAFLFADTPIPEVVTFNADPILDRLMFLLLPNGALLYPAGTDYTPGLRGSFIQACNLAFLRPTPDRVACFLQCVQHYENTITERPGLPMNGWIGFPIDLQSLWGLTQNYLMCRRFGLGSFTDAELDAVTPPTGAYVSDQAGLAIQRTAHSISSFCWQGRGDAPAVLGMTMPLNRDILCYPMPWNLIGMVSELPDAGHETAPALAYIRHSAKAIDGGFGVMLDLAWAGGKVAQQCAFIALPDGRSVYVERRTALADVALEKMSSGTITFFDDERLLYQNAPRRYVGEEGILQPDESRFFAGNWLNVDDQLGIAVLGASFLTCYREPGVAEIFRGDETMYDTCRLAFAMSASTEPLRFLKGEDISRCIVVSCPGHSAEETQQLAHLLAGSKDAWFSGTGLVLNLGEAVVHVNFSDDQQHTAYQGHQRHLDANSCGWYGPWDDGSFQCK